MCEWIKKIKKVDYRHYINIIITLGFVALGYLFINSIPRLVESIRDLGVSIGFYFCGIAMSANPIVATVVKMPSWEIMPSVFEPLTFFPMTWEEFQVQWTKFSTLFVSKDNLQDYFSTLGASLPVIARILLLLITLFIPLMIIARRSTEKYNNNYDHDSKPLRVWKQITFHTYYPVKKWLKEYIAFLKETPYVKIWLWIWALYFNIISVIIEFLAFYLYFIVSFAFQDIYTQALKLIHDATPMIRFVPVFVWIGVGIIAYEWICRESAYARLYHNERCNRGFINSLGIMTVVWGEMGIGKTALITDMALSAEVELRDQAFEIMLENDMRFPRFPWVQVRNELKNAIEKRVVTDVWTCRKWIRNLALSYMAYKIAQTDKAMSKSWRRHTLKQPPKYGNLIFGYDDTHYPITFDDKLKVIDIWQAIEDYACAYLIYSCQCSLIISNYSIRVDAILQDMGNFPVWNADFFRRDSRLLDSFSRHSHILDFNMLRLGKRMLDSVKDRSALGFGVYVISEIDKERKNTPNMQELKATAEECNQKNDLFDSCVKMIRHAVVIAHREFVRIFADLQRPEDWSASGREVGGVVYIREETDITPTLPFYSWFWIIEGIFLWTKRKFVGFYTEFIYGRGDNTLFLWLLKGIVARLDNYIERTNNLFGSATLRLEIESGRMEGEVKRAKYSRMPKKIFSRRYRTDCLSAIFQNEEVTHTPIWEFIEYAGDVARADELALQNSHFQAELKKQREFALKQNTATPSVRRSVRKNTTSEKKVA